MNEPNDRSRFSFAFASLAATLSHRVRVEHPPHTITATNPARRDAHPKHHGCVCATFTVRDDVPAALQHGVFKPGARYTALIRYSNAFKVRHDMALDARGMAIKLLDVEGPRVTLPDLEGVPPQLPEEDARTQDFLLVTHAQFFGRTAAEFYRIVSGIIKDGGSPRFVLTFISLKPPRIGIRNILALFGTLRWTSNPLFLSYFSQTPYSVDDDAGSVQEPRAAKFCARPRQHPSPLQRLRFYLRVLAALFHQTKATENLLREALSRYLAERDATYDFCVQLRTDPDSMPLDDATRRWSTSASPYVPVATIRIHQDDGYKTQEFIAKRLALGEHLSYTPWHALAAHRPLGDINLARLFAYAKVSRTRLDLNGTNAKVPDKVCKHG